MTKENLKQLIKEHYIGISEAIWLIKKYDIADIPTKKTDNLIIIAKDVLEFIKAKNTASESLTLEEELYFFSTINKLEVFISYAEEDNEEDDYDAETKSVPVFGLYSDGNEDEDEDDERLDFFNNPLSKEQKAELKEKEQKIFFRQGQKKVVAELITLIDAEFPLVYNNGFNRAEFQRVKGRFWNTIGFKRKEYAWVSMEAREFLQAVYKASEPFILKKVAEKELITLPDLTTKYANWISENKYKSNKTNLKQYLKENDIRLSNPNIDKVLDNPRWR